MLSFCLSAHPPPPFPICLFSLSISLAFSLAPLENKSHAKVGRMGVGASGGSIFDLGCTLPMHDSLKSRRFPVTSPRPAAEKFKKGDLAKLSDVFR